MSKKIDKIRVRIFKIWFLTLAVVIVAFAEKISGIRDLAPPFASTFQSFQMMVGLVIPQIALMSAFYLNLDKHRRQLESLSNEQVTVISMLSLAYHGIFIVAIISGICFYAFDQQADGKSLERNTAAVVAIMGLFSVFLAPIAFLFSRPSGAEGHERGEITGVSEVTATPQALGNSVGVANPTVERTGTSNSAVPPLTF